MPRTRSIIIAALIIPPAIWTVDSTIDAVLGKTHGFTQFWLGTGPDDWLARLLVTLVLSLVLGGFFLGWARIFKSSAHGDHLDDQFSTLLENSPGCIVIHRNDRIVFANRNTLVFFDDPDFKRFRDTSFLGFIHPRFLDIVVQRRDQVITTGQASEVMEIQVIMPDDSIRDVSLSTTTIEYEGQPSLLTFFRDITEQACIHRELNDSRERLQLALEIRNRIARVFLIDEDQSKYRLLLETIVENSESSCGFFATLDEDQSLRVWSVHPPEATTRTQYRAHRISPGNQPPFLKPVIDEQKSQILDQPHLMGEIGLEFQNALTVPIVNREKVIGIIMLGNRAQGFFESDRASLESLASFLAPILQSHLTSEMRELQLRQAQKMEALGALAGGIAHDFNNILQAIMGFTTLAKDDAPRDGTIEGDLQKVLKASQRGKNLVQRILLFSRREEQEQQDVHINSIVNEALELLVPTLPTTIEVRTCLAEDCGQIMADPSQINQVIMNLATNAFHAMEDDGGVLEIGLRLLAEDDHGFDRPKSLHGQKVIMMWLTDTGCGIEQQELDRVFDPFYTTKEVGRGTGLGLSVVHGIVVSHGGDVQITSTPDQGTTARVFLPSLAAATRIQQEGDPRSTPVPTGAHIMFVDDEEDIVTLGRAMLEKQGFRVTAMSDGILALAKIQGHPENYDLVVTDLTMPHLTGLQLADGVARIRSNLPVILITGQGEEKDKKLETHPQIRGIVHKPFDLETLYEAITNAMASSPDGEP